MSEDLEAGDLSAKVAANRHMSEAMQLLLDPRTQGDARVMLETAQRQSLWHTLGYPSWDECLGEWLRSIHPLRKVKSKRLSKVLRLYREGLNIGSIANALDISRITASRDLNDCREMGILDDRRQRDNEPLIFPVPQPRRYRQPDYENTWEKRIFELSRLKYALISLRGDERYPSNLYKLSEKYMSEISETTELLIEIGQDFSLKDDLP